MYFKILTEIGRHYLNEEGTEGVRRMALGGLENLLGTVYSKANVAKAFAFEHQVANVNAWGASGRVKDLIQFHEKQQTKWQGLDKANEEIIRVRQWLHRQNAVLTAEGKIIWAKSVRKVEYDKDLKAQGNTMLKVNGGKLYTSDDRLFDTKSLVTHFSGPGFAIYVMSREGNIHVSSHSVGYRHHSSLLGGAMVAGAGEMKVTAGKIEILSNKSGHYRPDPFHLLQTIHSLYLKGVPIDFRITCLGKDGAKNYGGISQFLDGEGFDDSTVEAMQILHGYGHYLTPSFLKSNKLMWVQSTQGKLLGGIYDVSVMPWRKVPYEEFSKKMKQAGNWPKFVWASGSGR